MGGGRITNRSRGVARATLFPIERQRLAIALDELPAVDQFLSAGREVAELAGDFGLFRLSRLRQLALELGQLFLTRTALTKITFTLRGAHAMVP